MVRSIDGLYSVASEAEICWKLLFFSIRIVAVSVGSAARVEWLTKEAAIRVRTATRGERGMI
jgi:hypothetical protein